MFDLRQFGTLAPEWYECMHYHQELESTNDEAHRLAAEGAGHGTLILAEHQTAGRGRRGALWACEPGDGLLFSLILRPSFLKLHWSRIALATGLGIAEGLQDHWGVEALVKWPNDIYVGDKKCAGILAEARDNYVVVGVGINVMAAPRASDSGIAAVALADVAMKAVSREGVLATLLPAIMAQVDSCAHDFEEQLRRLQGKCYLTGKRIHFTAHERVLGGLVCGIGRDGALQVAVDGILHDFSQASDIRVV